MTTNSPHMKDPRTPEELFFEAAQRFGDLDQREDFLDAACANDPALRRRLDELFAAQQDAEQFFKQGVEGLMPPDPLTEPGDANLTATSANLTESPGTMIGRYKLLQKIGEGGMGVVYMAQQQEPVSRKVALKIIKLGMDTKQVVARFEAERQALAMMDHPNIAKVLDGGATESGRPFFVMELVRGVPITEYCDKNQLATPQRLDLFIQVCRAVQHAHQKGIIHRDLKPSNILVTLNDGVPLPMVIDFGIAKATSQKLTEKTLFTNYAQMIGTPAYMSPEQAEMSKLDVDTRTDIYALGVLLYELLTGTTPFPAKELLSLGFGEMQRVIAEREPLRPSNRLSTMANEERTAVAKNRNMEASALGKLFRGDLDWIVMKALEKDRARRYDTANGLAMDVQRHLDNEPIIARPPSAAYRFRKFARRNKGILAGATVATIAVLAGLVVATVSFVREHAALEHARASAQQARRAEITAKDEQQRADGEALKFRRLRYASDMAIAWEAHGVGNTALARKLIQNHLPTNVASLDSKSSQAASELPGWEWRYLWLQTKASEHTTISTPGSRPRALSFHPSGHVLASAGSDKVIRVWDWKTRAQEHSVHSSNDVQSLAFSPDGNYLAASGDDYSTLRQSRLTIYDASSLEEITILSKKGFCFSVAFAPDGKFLAGNVGHEVKIWETGTWRELVTCDTSKGFDRSLWIYEDDPFVTSVVISQDSRTVAASTFDGRIHVFDAQTGSLKVSWQAYDWNIGTLGGGTTLALARNGESLVSAATYSNLRPSEVGKVWDIRTGLLQTNLTLALARRSPYSSVAFSPDGSTLASGDRWGGIALWNVTNWQSDQTLPVHEAEVRCVAFSPDGQWLASGSSDETIRLWNPKTPLPPKPFHAFPPGAQGFGRSQDMRHIAIFFTNGTFACWEVPSMRPIASGKTNHFPTFSPLGQLSNGGTLAAWVGGDGSITLADLRAGRELTNWVVFNKNPMPGLAFSFDDNSLATFGRDEQLTLWDLHPLRKRWAKPITIEGVVFSTDNQRIYCGARAGDRGRVIVLDAGTGSGIQSLPIRSIASYCSVSRDGRTIATFGVARDEIDIWSLDSPKEPRTSLKLAAASHFAFVLSPDAQCVAVLTNEGVRMYELNTGQEIGALRANSVALGNSEFIEDGNVLVLVTVEGVYIWRAPSWPEIAGDEAKNKSKDIAR